MAGGISIVLFIAMHLFIAKSTSTSTLAWVAYYLAFLVNYPHFAASYQLLYGDSGKFFFDFKRHYKHALRLWWAGVVMPLLLLAYLAYAFMQGSAVLFGYTVNAMFFFVGWHYVRQIFGCVIVLSAAKKIFFSPWERRLLQAPLYAIWGLSFVNANTYGYMNVFHGVSYSTFTLTDKVIPALYTLLAVTSALCLGMTIAKYVRQKALLPLSAWAALISIYLWYIPAFSHPHFFLVIPFFHSLQYLLFVTVYKKNQFMEKDTKGARVNEKRGSERAIAIASTVFLLVPLLLSLYLFYKPYMVSVEKTLRQGISSMLSVAPLHMIGVLALWIMLVLMILHVRHSTLKSPAGRLALFIGQATLLGAILFSLAPTVFDALGSFSPSLIVSYNTTIFGSTLFLFLFTIFVNIHHYFIDNVLWRRDNPCVKEFLKGNG
jgi:hypothetical protein